MRPVPRASTPGEFANQTGTTLEAVVQQTLATHGFPAVPWTRWRRHPDRYGPEILLRHVPYTTIYGGRGWSEFVLRSAQYGLTARIECKWQQASGSVDEKFPYLYLNAAYAMPEPLVLLVIDGGGAKPAAVQWLRETAQARRFLAADAVKTIRVFTLAEFVAWANSTFRRPTPPAPTRPADP